MTADELNAALDILGWTPRTLAAALNVDSRNPRRWSGGNEPVPAGIAAWVGQMAALAANPPEDWNVVPTDQVAAVVGALVDLHDTMAKAKTEAAVDLTDHDLDRIR
jgi:hypothetical protein